MGFQVVKTSSGQSSKHCLLGSGSETLPSNKDYLNREEYNVQEHCTPEVKQEVGGKQLFRPPVDGDHDWDITRDTCEHTHLRVRDDRKVYP